MHKLNDELLESVTKRNNLMLWKIEEVLISWEKDGEFIWRTRNFKEVRVKEIEWVWIWDLVKVKIIELDRYVLKWEFTK